MAAQIHRTRILIQRADRLGDMILALPAIEAVIEKYPNARIDILASGIGKKALEGHPKINAIIEANWGLNQKLQNKEEVKKQIQKGCYDIYIALWNHPQFAWMAYQSRIPIRIGDSNKWPLKYLYTHTADSKPNLITQHQIIYNLKVLSPMGISLPQEPITKLYIPESEQKAIEVEFQKYYRPRVRWIAICIATGGSSTPIPESVIIELISRFDADEWNIVLIGPNDVPQSFKDISRSNVIKVLGNSIQNAMAAINYCEFYIGPDTGLTHIASFLKKTMVVVSPIPQQFPGRWAPLSPYFDIIRQEYSHCNHSPKYMCKAECQTYITADLIYKTLDNLIYKLNIKDAMTPLQIKQKRLLHTFRILIIVENEFDFLKFRRLSQLWEDSQFIMIPIRIPKDIYGASKEIIKKCLKHNATIVHGEVPFIIQVIVRFVIDKILQYVKPCFTYQLPVTEHITPDEYLAHYDAITNNQFKTN
jgi:heptosyltransferase-3